MVKHELYKRFLLDQNGESIKDDKKSLFINVFEKYGIDKLENSASAGVLLSIGTEYEDERLIIPDYQRDLVWTLEQKQNLIKSIFAGADIGTVYFARQRYDENSKKLEVTTFNVIDGQQRLNAIYEYVNDGFKVNNLKFSELPQVDKRAFLVNNKCARYVMLFEPSREMELDIYYNLNFGGTRHTEKDLERFKGVKK